MKQYDVLIIGAGPGGIFSAFELIHRNSSLRVAVFETGKVLEKRRCPIDGKHVKECIHCPTCSIMTGFGGAGAFSDGKYNITTAFGGTLHKYIGKEKALELMNQVDSKRLGPDGDRCTGRPPDSGSFPVFPEIYRQRDLARRGEGVNRWAHIR